jgi:hypothetical protein
MANKFLPITQSITPEKKAHPNKRSKGIKRRRN